MTKFLYALKQLTSSTAAKEAASGFVSAAAGYGAPLAVAALAALSAEKLHEINSTGLQGAQANRVNAYCKEFGAIL